MNREEMVKRHWKPYQVVNYQDEGMKFPAECLLSAIDFDAEILTLTPINDFYNQQEFQANLKFCSIPKGMKVAAVNGKRIPDPSENFIKAKKFQ
jgi:hypothetical protein